MFFQCRGRIKQTFQCKIINTAYTVYGRDYGFGDRCSATYDGLQFDVMVRGITGQVANGLETITPTLETYL